MRDRFMTMSRNSGVLVATIVLWWCWAAKYSEGTAPPVVVCSQGNESCVINRAFGLWEDRKDCKAAKVVYPTTEEEIVTAVAEAVKAGQKVRVISKGSHSIQKLVCPGGQAGLSISTRDYNSKIVVDEVLNTATVDAGVQLKHFVDTIASKGLAFPHSPYWDGLSISGILGTGAHGSSIWGKGSAVFEYIKEMRLVVPASAAEGYARVITLMNGDEDLNAAKVSLGVLGVISTVTLQLQPLFKRTVSFVQLDDSNLETQILTNAQQNEFGDVSWFPALKTAVYRLDNRVSVSTPGNGINNFAGFAPLAISVSEINRALEETDENLRSSGAKCVTALAQLTALSAVGYGWTNDGVFFEGYPITGFQNSLQTSGSCQDASYEAGFVCAWDPRGKGEFFYQTTFTVSFSRIGEFILDIKALVAARPSALCGLGLYNGILMRYVKKSSGAYLGEIDDGVSMDFTYFRNSDAQTPRVDEDVLEEIEQMILFKYHGKPHWGKNRRVGFLTIPTLFVDLPKFLQVKNRLDPQGLFSNEWTDAVLDVNGAAATLQIFQPFCALEGLCICTQDIHCAPQSGYFCRPGLVYKEARVCRYTLLP